MDVLPKRKFSACGAGPTDSLANGGITAAVLVVCHKSVVLGGNFWVLLALLF